MTSELPAPVALRAEDWPGVAPFYCMCGNPWMRRLVAMELTRPMPLPDPRASPTSTLAGSPAQPILIECVICSRPYVWDPAASCWQPVGDDLRAAVRQLF